VRAYLAVMHDALEKSGDDLTCYSPVDARFLSLDTLCQAARHLKAAEAAVQDDAALRQRVQVARLPVLYTFLMRWQPLRDEAATAKTAWPLADSRSEVYDEFMRIAKAAEITHIREGAPGFAPLQPPEIPQ
jgi:hypothetical protein